MDYEILREIQNRSKFHFQNNTMKLYINHFNFIFSLIIIFKIFSIILFIPLIL